MQSSATGGCSPRLLTTPAACNGLTCCVGTHHLAATRARCFAGTDHLAATRAPGPRRRWAGGLRGPRVHDVDFSGHNGDGDNLGVGDSEVRRSDVASAAESAVNHGTVAWPAAR